MLPLDGCLDLLWVSFIIPVEALCNQWEHSRDDRNDRNWIKSNIRTDSTCDCFCLFFCRLHLNFFLLLKHQTYLNTTTPTEHQRVGRVGLFFVLLFHDQIAAMTVTAIPATAAIVSSSIHPLLTASPPMKAIAVRICP